MKHRDTEKDVKMFGTLIIQPPSLHTGGELVVYGTNGSANKVVDFGQKDGSARYSVHYTAHWADLEHELREVTSGYRLAIVYSLCWVTGISFWSFLYILCSIHSLALIKLSK